MRRHARVPELLACRSSCTGAAQAVCHYCNHARQVPRTCQNVRRRRSSNCSGYGTERVEAEVPAALPGGPGRAPGPRHGAAQGRGGRDCWRRFGDGRARRPGRHPDDREGARLPARDAGGRHLGRRRPRAGGLPRGRADVPAADPGGRPGRARRARRARPSSRRVYPGPLQRRARLPPGLPRRSSSRSWRSGARCATRRWWRSSTASCAASSDRDAMSARGRSGASASGSAGGRTPFLVLGPAPAPLARLRGEHRAQFFVKGAPAARGRCATAVLAALGERPDLRRQDGDRRRPAEHPLAEAREP
ncbi:MAG: hypothetical protein MZV64_73125 [Ignavibacteriales bacterium]|nr:hypothetical protein [Ignavibacteriales bacterium]